MANARNERRKRNRLDVSNATGGLSTYVKLERDWAGHEKGGILVVDVATGEQLVSEGNATPHCPECEPVDSAIATLAAAGAVVRVKMLRLAFGHEPGARLGVDPLTAVDWIERGLAKADPDFEPTPQEIGRWAKMVTIDPEFRAWHQDQIDAAAVRYMAAAAAKSGNGRLYAALLDARGGMPTGRERAFFGS